jgi:hypothetical protein
MDKEKLKVYTCSSVGIDYFLFLNKTISEAGFDSEPLFLITEEDYRKLAKQKGFRKIWLRIKMYVLYPLMLIQKGFKSEKGSVFVVSSNTFFAPYLVHLILKIKKVKVIHLLYDLFPDALEVAGSIKPDSFFSKMIGKAMIRSQRNCESTVYLGNFLMKHAENRWGKAKISKVIDISTDLTLYGNELKSLISKDKIIIHYGGQLGHLHDADSIIDSIKFICSSDIAEKVEFNFYVSGTQALFLKESLKEYPVKIISAVPSSQWRNDINNFHIGLVSLSPGGASVCLPSKTYGMMAGGLSILAICPQWSDLSNLVTKLDAGWVINNSIHINEKDLYTTNYLQEIKDFRNKKEIISDFYLCLKNILKDKELLEIKRQNAFNGVRSDFNIRSLSEKWKDVISNTN